MAGETLEATAHTKLFTQLSRVRVEAGSLLGALGDLTDATEPKGHAGLAEGALEEAVRTWIGALDTAKLDEKRAGLTDLLNGEDDLHGFAEDAWSVVNALSRLRDRWPPGVAGKVDAASLATSAKDSGKILREVVYYCSRVTIPTEVEEQLETLHVGKPLDFNATFKPKLPSAAQRKQILAGLKNRRIGGWVDDGAGLIYKLSRDAPTRVLTCIAPFLLAALAAGFMYLIPTFGLPGDWNLGNPRWQLVGAFGLVIAGAVIHLLVENVKQLQSRSVPIVAITDGVYWLNLRWIGLSLTVLWALVVAIGLRAIGLESTGAEGVGSYLAAGYSLDSVAGLVLTRFDSSAGVLLRKVNAQVTGDENGNGADGGAPAATPA